ncbi:putative aarF domain-containing protein kinase 1 isoform X1 [Senna tora]|uniref:Putative aarF domain-containing protein kinase 1 isoform X1 n=1 Tax=Senna tora TaxID=362788 RepID=A0A834U1V8_9FABA|nr:putative aarF domain-containing protein kinase 1 isoform X1 [Senna tora]
MRAKPFRFPAKTKSAVFLAAAAAALISYRATASSDSFHPPSKLSQQIGTDIHGIVRTARAVSTVACNIADYKYSLRGLDEGSEEYRLKMSEIHLRSAKRLVKLCEKNKGFYVKAGQFVSAQSMLPKEYLSTLSALQDQVAPCPFKVIQEVLLYNLGPDFSEKFLSINEEPIAAASISQVHHAVLRSGDQVAIKVQYPGIEQKFKFDTKTMSFLSKTIAWIFPDYRFEWLVSAFTNTLLLELDFVHEARNSERAAKNFRNSKLVKVPHVFWELTTKQVLTMEFYKGRKGPKTLKPKLPTVDSLRLRNSLIPSPAQIFVIFVKSKTTGFLGSSLVPKIDDLDFLKQIGVDPEKVCLNYKNDGLDKLWFHMIYGGYAARALVEMFAEMIFVHGYIHGDPHPGNILVSPEGFNGFSLVLLDHGVYWELDEEYRKDFCQLWEALLLKDSKKIMSLSERFGVGKYYKYLPFIFIGGNIESKPGFGGGKPDFSGSKPDFGGGKPDFGGGKPGFGGGRPDFSKMSDEDRENIKKQMKSFFMDFTSFMESLPSEFLAIMRVDGFLRAIIRRFDVSRWIRLLAYAKYGLYGIYLKSDAELDFAGKGKAVFFRFIYGLKYCQILIKLTIGDIVAKVVLPSLPWLLKVKSAIHSLHSKMNSDFWGLLVHSAVLLFCIRPGASS